MTFGVSFIVPAFNEELYIGQCLESIIRQTEHSEIPVELIVVDSNSTDKTADIAKKFSNQVLSNTVKGNPSITRNIGARHAQYSILCFIDGDCILADNWIERLITTFSDKKIGAYGGPILSPENGNWVEKAWAPTESPAFLKSNSALAGANFSIRKDLFESLRGFNEDLISAEDDDLSKRVINSGSEICYDSRQSVVHLGYPKSLAGILKKQIWHGSSQIRAHGLFSDKVVILTLMFLIILIGFLITFSLGNRLLAAITGVLLIAIPGLLVYGRSQKFPTRNTTLYIKMYLISCAFMIGRSVGLIKEIGRKLG